MAKEITLEQLAKSTPPKKTTSEAKPVEKAAETTETKEIPTPQNTGKKFRPITTSQLGRAQEAKHPEEVAAKKGNVIDAPILTEAVESMERTIAERKERIEKELMPIVYKNAEEIAAENAGMAKPDDNVGSNIMNEISEDDDIFAELNDEPEQVIDRDYAPTFEPDRTYEEEPEQPVIPSAAARLREQQQEAEEKAKTEEKPAPVVEEPKETSSKVVSIEKAKEEKAQPTQSSGENLDELLKDLGINGEADLEADDETPEEIRERFKENFHNVKIIQNPINLGGFKIRTSPTSSSSILNAINGKNKNKHSDWVLWYTGRSVTFEECKGPELDNLYKTIQNSNNVNAVIASLQFIYNHIVDANKPKFEQWTKMIRTEDIESLYFGMYRACYSDYNLVPRTCVEKTCKKTSLIECDINEMVKFDNDETKEKFYEIMNKDTTTPSKTIKSSLLQISDDLVISYSEPTLFKTFIQYAALKDEVVQKYSDTLNTMAYIDNFFAIDRDTQELIPLTVAEYPNDLGKTVLSKLKVFIGVLKSLNNDQFNALTGKLNSLIDEDAKVYYVYPELKCPECGATIPEASIGSCMNLLFTRAQLARVQSS